MKRQIRNILSIFFSTVFLFTTMFGGYPCNIIKAKALSSVQIEFVEKVAYYAQQHYEESKILPSFVAAQALLESKSGNGLSGLATNYNNFWGMKAGS